MGQLGFPLEPGAAPANRLGDPHTYCLDDFKIFDKRSASYPRTRGCPTLESFTIPSSVSTANGKHLSFYLPSIAGSEIKSERDICDGKWHFIGVHFAYDRVRLYVDGERVVDRSIDEPLAPDEPVGVAQPADSTKPR